jgi:hypothetical protein
MLDGATKSILQGYNAQITVDSHSQIIVAGALTQEANDKQQLAPQTPSKRGKKLSKSGGLAQAEPNRPFTRGKSTLRCKVT